MQKVCGGRKRSGKNFVWIFLTIFFFLLPKNWRWRWHIEKVIECVKLNSRQTKCHRRLNVHSNANFRGNKFPFGGWDWDDANAAIIKSKRFHSTHILSRASTQNVCNSDAILFLFRLHFNSTRLDFPSFTLLCRTRTHSLSLMHDTDTFETSSHHQYIHTRHSHSLTRSNRALPSVQQWLSSSHENTLY